MKLYFKEWFLEADSLTSPDGGGEIWTNRSNADRDFGRTGAKSKTVGDGVTPEKTDFDPDELFLGKDKKRCKRSSILGGIRQ
jgi:hypothetical protein